MYYSVINYPINMDPDMHHRRQRHESEGVLFDYDFGDISYRSHIESASSQVSDYDEKREREKLIVGMKHAIGIDKANKPLKLAGNVCKLCPQLLEMKGEKIEDLTKKPKSVTFHGQKN